MLDYVRLLEANNGIQTVGDDTYWLCVTRTVQESKLFPVPAYMMLSYMMAFYRYPSLLRKIESRISAEEIGDRVRNAGIKIQNPSMGWALPGFYLLGREWLISLGLTFFGPLLEHPHRCPRSSAVDSRSDREWRVRPADRQAVCVPGNCKPAGRVRCFFLKPTDRSSRWDFIGMTHFIHEP